MPDIFLSGETDIAGWRNAARVLAARGVPPEEVSWSFTHAPDLLTTGSSKPVVSGDAPGFKISRRFVDLAETALLHAAPDRFAFIYRLLFRLRQEPRLLDVASDPDVARAERMAKNVRRDIHKMHAFVRFREIAEENGSFFVAWFEPQHHIIKAGAPFFVRRFPNMRWSILSPAASAHWDGHTLAFGSGTGRASAPTHDALEDLWRSYYAAIFNPARLKVQAMRSEMPQKYWRNLPEASLIGPLIADARKRMEEMITRAPTEARIRRQRLAEAPALVPQSNDPLAALRTEALHCKACPLWKPATQTVFGEGPVDAPLVFIGEQPGDKEDLDGRPFVGPAGQLFDRALQEAGIDRAKTYVTNAVKHFKFVPRGKIRLHQKPVTPEIRACHQWLERELEIIRPKLVVAMGATAAQSLFGKATPIGRNRGHVIEFTSGFNAVVTVHPSYLLRVPEADRKAEEYAKFLSDLRLACKFLQAA